MLYNVRNAKLWRWMMRVLQPTHSFFFLSLKEKVVLSFTTSISIFPIIKSTVSSPIRKSTLNFLNLSKYHVPANSQHSWFLLFLLFFVSRLNTDRLVFPGVLVEAHTLISNEQCVALTKSIALQGGTIKSSSYRKQHYSFILKLLLKKSIQVTRLCSRADTYSM